MKKFIRRTLLFIITTIVIQIIITIVISLTYTKYIAPQYSYLYTSSLIDKYK